MAVVVSDAAFFADADADELEELLREALGFVVAAVERDLADPWSLSVLSDTLDFDPGPLELLFDDPRTSLPVVVCCSSATRLPFARRVRRPNHHPRGNIRGVFAEYSRGTKISPNQASTKEGGSGSERKERKKKKKALVTLLY